RDWDVLADAVCTQVLPRLLAGDGAALLTALRPVADATTRHGGPVPALCAAARHLHDGRFAALARDVECGRPRLDPAAPGVSRTSRAVLDVLDLAVARADGDVDRTVAAAPGILRAIEAAGAGPMDSYRAVVLADLGAAWLWRGELTEAGACLDDAFRLD